MVDIEQYLPEIAEVFRENDAPVDPLPEIKLDDSDQGDGPFVKTGHDDATEKVITIFTRNRQIKDILRTLSHELVHHSQNLSNPEMMEGLDTSGTLVTNQTLQSVEADAYLRGNIYFRMWTEKHTV